MIYDFKGDWTGDESNSGLKKKSQKNKRNTGKMNKDISSVNEKVSSIEENKSWFLKMN